MASAIFPLGYIVRGETPYDSAGSTLSGVRSALAIAGLGVVETGSATVTIVLLVCVLHTSITTEVTVGRAGSIALLTVRHTLSVTIPVESFVGSVSYASISTNGVASGAGAIAGYTFALTSISTT